MQWQMAGARCRGQPVRSCHASHTASHIRAAGTRSLAFYKALDSAQPATGLGRRTPTRPSAEATATAAVQTRTSSPRRRPSTDSAWRTRRCARRTVCRPGA